MRLTARSNPHQTYEREADDGSRTMRTAGHPVGVTSGALLQLHLLFFAQRLLRRFRSPSNDHATRSAEKQPPVLPPPCRRRVGVPRSALP